MTNPFSEGRPIDETPYHLRNGQADTEDQKVNEEHHRKLLADRQASHGIAAHEPFEVKKTPYHLRGVETPSHSK